MCVYYRKHGHYYRRKHLYSRLDSAREREDKEAASQILAIITREKDKRFWQRMSHALGKPRGGACFGCRLNKRMARQWNTLGRTTSTKPYGTTSTADGSTSQSPLPFANSPSGVFLVIMPFARLRKTCWTELMSIQKTLT